MNYETALNYILSFTDYENLPSILYSPSNFDLRRVEDLLGRLGNPHLGARSIHIAGTNGKGSIAAMVSAALCDAGYRTGLFTSPHLHTLRERIAVDGQLVAEEGLATLVEELRPHADDGHSDGAHGRLTTFEILTALAFLYFRERQVDFQVLEVGLGGRLDATNVVPAEVCVVTSIGLDHVAVLGDSIVKIAQEKVGIIKPGTVVVSSPQQWEAAVVIEEACLEKEARLIRVGNDLTWEKQSSDLSGQSFDVKGMAGCYDFRLPLLGDHQLENAATAVAVLEVLGIPRESIVSGLARVRWPGRLQILRHQPLFIVDGAHNVDSARRLRQTISQYFDFDRLILIIGTSSDKDIAGIIEQLVPISHTVFVTRSHHPRAAEPELLATEFARQGVKAHLAPDVAEAVSQALARAGKDDLVCAAGSLFVAAEAIEYARDSY